MKLSLWCLFCNLLIWLLSELFFSEVSFLFPRPSYFPLLYFRFCVILMKFFLSFFVLPQIWFCSLKQMIGYNKMVQFSRCCSPRRRSKARASRWLNGSLTGRLSITLNAVPQPIKGQSDVWSTTAAIIGGSICEKPKRRSSQCAAGLRQMWELMMGEGDWCVFHRRRCHPVI